MADEDKKARPLTQVIEGLRNAFEDLTTVEVLTFSGSLSEVIKKDAQGNSTGKIDWDSMKKFELTGELKLAAATRIDVDYDVINFRADALSDELRTLHEGAVTTSLEARRAFLDMFLDILKKN